MQDESMRTSLPLVYRQVKSSQIKSWFAVNVDYLVVNNCHLLLSGQMESGETDEGAGAVWRFLWAAGIQDRSSVPPHVGPQQAVPDTGGVLSQDELRQY